MTSLDRLPLTATPDLDPSGYNSLTTPAGQEIAAYYSPMTQRWMVHLVPFDFNPQRNWMMTGIDATDWPEVWAEIISKEQAG